MSHPDEMKAMGRPSLGITKKVSMTLSPVVWEWLERRSQGPHSNLFRNIILNSRRREMFDELLSRFPMIDMKVVKGNGEFREYLEIPKAQKEEIIKFILKDGKEEFIVIDKGQSNDKEYCDIIGISHAPYNYIGDHLIYE